ncbi:hypothetical protein GCM10009777_24840 [Microbacterium pumilum]|uniref:NUDIX hydrolase n=2 Tax=Microbacterium pumilum TaxID=344165 RepID=A0ABN2SLT3_9MICO
MRALSLTSAPRDLECTATRAFLETAFDVDGRRGHEVVHVFGVASPQLDELDIGAEIPVLDNHRTARWIPLDALRAGDPPFHPVGMAELAAARAVACGARQA